MRSVIFEDQGEVWGDAPRSLPEILQGHLPSAEAVNYAVRNLGYVAVSEGGGSARVRLRPAVVSPIAFTALCYNLADSMPDRILISWLDGTWSDNLFGSLQDAMRHMLDLLPTIDSGR